MGSAFDKSYKKSTNILVLGAHGSIGKEIVYELKKSGVNFSAAVKDANTTEANEFSKNGVKLCQADMAEDESALEIKFKGYQTIFINTPTNTDFQNNVLNSARAAKKARVKFIVVLSIAAVEATFPLAQQFQLIENGIRNIGIHYAILRLPFFTDRILKQATLIRDQKVFYGPIPGNVKFASVTVHDAAVVAAEMVIHYENYYNQTVYLTSDLTSYDELASGLSKQLGSEVKYVNSGYEKTKKMYLKQGVQERQVDSQMDVYHLIQCNHESVCTQNDNFKEIMGQNGTKSIDWIKQNVIAFSRDRQMERGNEIIVVDASERVGTATIQALVARQIRVTACLQDISDADLTPQQRQNIHTIQQLDTKYVKILKTDITHYSDQLVSILSHYHTVFLVPSEHTHYARNAVNVIKAASSADVNFILLLSLATFTKKIHPANLNDQTQQNMLKEQADMMKLKNQIDQMNQNHQKDRSDTPNNDWEEFSYETQMNLIKRELKKSSMNYGMLKIPILSEYIKCFCKKNAIYGPISDDIKVNTVSAGDAGIAAAVILEQPQIHYNKSYTIVSDQQSYKEMAKALSKAIQSDVSYLQQTYLDTQQSLAQLLPQWEVDNIIELLKQAQTTASPDHQLTPINTLRHFTGQHQYSNEQYFIQNKQEFINNLL